METPKKTVFLLCNAHIDPVWQWEWEEGAAQALSTFRVAADFCEDFDGFVFNHNEALLYRYVETYEPPLFSRIQKLVAQGKWHIMGGWELQPDCNMPSGESFVRQIMEGRRYFREKFGVEPSTAINFDPFGHTRGLVQIMAKTGYDSYVFCRPGNGDCPLEDETFRWVGYDGSEIMAQRMAAGYNTPLGESLTKISSSVDSCPEGGIALCLWGVGDHGGGPSRKDLEDIAVYQKRMEEQGVRVLHATPEQYFAALRESGRVLPRHEGDLNSWAPGCYTSQIRIKQKHREAENTYFMTEKVCTAAQMLGLMAYPQPELEQALKGIMFAQFHDSLPGSSIQPVEDMALRTLDYSLEILSQVKARAFFALAQGQKAAQPEEIPIMLLNPHPYEVEGDFACEFMLADQNWKDEFVQPVVYDNGVELPTQAEKECSSIPIQWRKRAVFHARLAPMSLNRFDCRTVILPAKPEMTAQEEDGCILVHTDELEVRIGKRTGLVETYRVQGTDYLGAGAMRLEVFQDSFDPWAHTVDRFDVKLGEFHLLDAAECGEMAGLQHPLVPVRVVENGAVRTVVEAAFGYKRSRAIVRYLIPKQGAALEYEVRVFWNETERMLKLAIPMAGGIESCRGEVAYGIENLPIGGRENVSQKYLLIQSGDRTVSLINDGVYGSSCLEDALLVTLLRSPSYTAQPLGDRVVLPQDRYMPHSDQGERLFRFRLQGGSTAQRESHVAREALFFNEKPMALSFFPEGGEGAAPSPIRLEGDTEICLTALKAAQNGGGTVIRLFNASDKPHKARLCVAGTAEKPVEFAPFEIVTLRLADEELTACPQLEI